MAASSRCCLQSQRNALWRAEGQPRAKRRRQGGLGGGRAASRKQEMAGRSMGKWEGWKGRAALLRGALKPFERTDDRPGVMNGAL